MAAASASRSIGLFQRAFPQVMASVTRHLNTASEAVAAAGTEAAKAEASKPKRRRKKNLFDVAQFLPNWGIGYKMAKSSWRDLSYEITKINLYKDGRHGKAWGIRYKAGVVASDAPVKMSGVNKPGWKYLKEAKKKTEESSKAEQPILP